jgi:putative transposase
MPSIRIARESNAGMYFLTFTVRNWYYLFDRHNRFDILADSLKYCLKHKGLDLFAYVFMLNHVHLLASSSDLAGFARDFKKFTSKRLQDNIIATEPNVLKLFETREGVYSIWAKGNMPKLCETEDYVLQKISYIHSNPVRKQYVRNAEDWLWSSANPESDIPVEPLRA